MFRINALFEAWLREATEKPLAAWKRTALLWRLQEDEELRCYAAELAEFNFETELAAPKAFSEDQQAWMRQRMQARLKDVGKGTLAEGNSAWVGLTLGLAVGLAVVAVVLVVPHSAEDASGQAANAEQSVALTLPSPTPTMTATPTPGPTLEAASSPTTPAAVTPAP